MGCDLIVDKILTEILEIATICIVYNNKRSMHTQHCISHHYIEGEYAM